MESNGRKLHRQAAKAREDGDHLKALQLSDETMLAYQKDGDVLGFTEILADRSITLRHLFSELGDENFTRLAKAEMVASVEIARASGNQEALTIPLFNLAKVQEEVGDSQAIASYKEVLETLANHPPAGGDRPGMVADFKIHLATCEYKNGDKEALARAEQSLTDLEAADEQKYEKDVWLSGAHMRIAEALRTDNPEDAKQHLQKAKEIIDSNPDLKLRLEQWNKLSETFN